MHNQLLAEVVKHLPGRHNQKTHGHAAVDAELNKKGLTTVLKAAGYEAAILATKGQYDTGIGYKVMFKDTGNVVSLDHIQDSWDNTGRLKGGIEGYNVSTEIRKPPDDVIFTLLMLPELAKNSGYNQLWADSKDVPLNIMAQVWPRAVLQDEGDAPTRIENVFYHVLANEQSHGLWKDYTEEQLEKEAENMTAGFLEVDHDVLLEAEDAYNYQRSDGSRPVVDWLKDVGKQTVITYILNLD